LSGVAELERCLTPEKDLVGVSVDNVDLLAEVEKEKSLGVAERHFHVAGEVDVLAVTNDAVERSGLGGEVLGE